MSYSVARRAATKPGAPARKPSAQPSGGMPAYLKGGVNVVKPDSPAEQEAESVARTVASGGTAFGAGQGDALALAAKPKEDKVEKPSGTETPVKKAAAPKKSS